GAFRREFPGVSVRVLQPEAGRSVAVLVRSGRAEVGLSEVPVEDEDLIAKPFLVQELLAVCPPGFEPPPSGRITVARLRDLPIVTGPPGSRRGAQGRGRRPAPAAGPTDDRARVPPYAALAGRARVRSARQALGRRAVRQPGISTSAPSIESSAAYANPHAGEATVHRTPTTRLETRSPTPSTSPTTPYPLPRSAIGRTSAA